MKTYDEDNYLMLSGIRHYYYSKRHWCLVHLEQQWVDNRYTLEGQLLHEKADDPYLKESRPGRFFSRAMPVSSKHLGFSGVLDVVEFVRDDECGVSITGRKGRWRPEIIEFKRGKPKKDERDVVQLVAQVICLEEALDTSIKYAYLFYGKTRRRVRVDITPERRRMVKRIADEMHEVFNKQKNIGLEDDPSEKGDSLRNISLAYALKPDLDMEGWMFDHMDKDLVL